MFCQVPGERGGHFPRGYQESTGYPPQEQAEEEEEELLHPVTTESCEIIKTQRTCSHFKNRVFKIEAGAGEPCFALMCLLINRMA